MQHFKTSAEAASVAKAIVAFGHRIFSQSVDAGDRSEIQGCGARHHPLKLRSRFFPAFDVGFIMQSTACNAKHLESAACECYRTTTNLFRVIPTLRAEAPASPN